jgi:hypothetical protein
MAVQRVTVSGVEYPLAPIDPPSAQHPTAEWMAVTPVCAERWMQANASNRGFRKRHSANHLRDMTADKWMINGDAIKLSRPLRRGEVEDLPEGYVMFMDGQHRLEACISSGKPFVTLVVYGLEPESRDTMDTGISRTMADVLKMEGHINAPVVASVLRRIWMWRIGDKRFSGTTRPTHGELLELYQKDPNGFDSAADKGYWVKSSFADASPSVVATAYYLCYEVSPSQAPWFFARLKDGAELPVGSPILSLRNRLTRERVEKRTAIPHHQLALILKAWNHYRDDQSISRLQQALDDPTPDPK